MSDNPGETPPPPIDLDRAFRNIVGELQAEPQRYKLFGVYWWPVKALLKRHGYGPDQLPMLGSYQDTDCAARVPKIGLEAMLRAAFEEYSFNAAFPHPGGMVEDPEGELVLILDADAGL